MMFHLILLMLYLELSHQFQYSLGLPIFSDAGEFFNTDHCSSSIHVAMNVLPIPVDITIIF